MANLLGSDITTLLNRANQQEVESYEWSFLYTTFTFNTFAPITDDFCFFVQGQTVVSNISGNFPTSFPTNAEQYWVLAGGSNVWIPMIIDTQFIANLATAWPAASFNGPAQICPRFYTFPGIQEIYGVQQLFDLTEISENELNALDPNRQSLGGNPSVNWAKAGWSQPYITATGIGGNYQIELWPVPSAQVAYVVEGKLAAVNMVNSTDNPQVPSAVIENKALMDCATALYASTGDPRWMTMANTFQGRYQYERDQAIVADQHRMITRGVGRHRHGPYSLDVIYDHDLDYN
jgi:hypothetical protein